MFDFKRYNYDSFSNHELIRHAARTGFGRGPEPGEKAPDFELRDLEGNSVRLSDYEGEKNVVLTFGSATCPFTASAIGRLNDLYEQYEDDRNVEFLFVYIREAHPGEKLPAHKTYEDKVHAAKTFRNEEDMEMRILVDDVDGKVHKKYGKMPNPTYLIDKSGRVAFRTLWSKVNSLSAALEELLELQDERGTHHAVIHGGDDTSVPLGYAVLHSHRALDRGGDRAIREFREGLGRPGRLAHTAGRVVGPVVLNPGRALAISGLTASVIAGGLYVGYRLRQARINRSLDPYHYGTKPESSENDYAVGI
jgi:peroxiredoxin